MELFLPIARKRGMSDGQIAEHCGVDEKYVRNLAKDLHEIAPTPDCPESQKESDIAPFVKYRTGKDGRTINVANIGKAKGNGNRKP